MWLELLRKRKKRGNLAGLLAGLLALSLPAQAQLSTSPLLPRAPLLITPQIAGVLTCDESEGQLELTTIAQIEDWCAANGYEKNLSAISVLNRMEPSGPKDKVQLGYTLMIPLLTLFDKQGDEWVLNKRKADRYLAVIAVIKRPVVIYLMADHFDASSALSRELAKDSRNLMSYATGSATGDRYFGTGVLPYTLRTDESIPVNRYRFEALRYLTGKISNLSEPARSLVAAVTLAGEIHHFYPDFENGVGAYENIRITDYSPASQQDFRTWLQHKYSDIANLNHKLGFHFEKFSDIQAPALDIRKDRLTSFAQHFDSFAGGQLPMFGWIWDPSNTVQRMSLFVDGKHHAPVAQNLGRMDVYRAKNEVTSTHTGFRGFIDFRSMKPGKHVAQIVAEVGKTRYLVDEREFVIVPRDQSSIADAPSPQRIEGLPSIGSLPSIEHWLDMPRAMQDVYYNPMAQEWNQFREHQVMQMLTHFYRIARSEGLPASMLYSHQIIPDINGTWNPVLFASDSSVSNTTPWRTGINLYGDSPHIVEFIKSRHIRAYGVPEFNPQDWKNPDSAYQALVRHYLAGAKFVSPFYLAAFPKRLVKAGSNLQFYIDPENKTDGADQLFNAVQTLVRQ